LLTFKSLIEGSSREFNIVNAYIYFVNRGDVKADALKSLADCAQIFFFLLFTQKTDIL
jgi:hypothetical protein